MVGVDLLDQYNQLEEENLRAAMISSGEPNGGLKRVLELADEWRAANCTPVIIVVPDSNGQVLACVSRETFDRKKLN